MSMQWPGCPAPSTTISLFGSFADDYRICKCYSSYECADGWVWAPDIHSVIGERHGDTWRYSL